MTSSNSLLLDPSISEVVLKYWIWHACHGVSSSSSFLADKRHEWWGSGFTRERSVHSSLCKNSLAGDYLVVACIVLLYDRRKFWTLCCREQAGSDAEYSRECLKVCPNHSARPFEDGSYGETRIQDVCSFVSEIPHAQWTGMVGHCHWQFVLEDCILQKCCTVH